MTPALRTAQIGEIPVLWAEPPQAGYRRLALWLHPFGGTKEGVEPLLLDLARRGFVAVSFDALHHGERLTETRDAFRARVRSNLRRHFWPILARTADEVPQVIDWAQAAFDIAPQVAIGGISMGGDSAVAAAAVDRRIERVAATLATPDWLRPGSLEPPGEADDVAWALYRSHNPLTNLAGYRHCPAITFECGETDRQVPPDGAIRFAEALRSAYADSPERLAVNLHAEVGHSFNDSMWRRALDWLDATPDTENARPKGGR